MLDGDHFLAYECDPEYMRTPPYAMGLKPVPAGTRWRRAKDLPELCARQLPKLGLVVIVQPINGLGEEPHWQDIVSTVGNAGLLTLPAAPLMWREEALQNFRNSLPSDERA